MRIIKENHNGISTILSFALIPISGFATDIYIPSLPSMATSLHVGNSAVQLSLVIFMLSLGLSQLFVGSLLDSFGRFRLGIAALLVFALASFAIAISGSIGLIYAMRVIQGIAVAFIVVSKRAYFLDLYSGDRLRNYVSLFSIIWATAPITAPFLGGYLETAFGWASNFWFLGIFAMVILALELRYGGETLKMPQPFRLKPITSVYASTIKTADFTLGLVIIALSYSMLVIYGMTSPFIVEHVFHQSPVITGYCSLLSGVALMTGGIISKSVINKPLHHKVTAAISVQAIVGVIMLSTSGTWSNIYTLIGFTLLIHLCSGFIYNNIFAFCLSRFNRNGGMVSGITGGSMYILTSFFSYGMVNLFSIQSQGMLAIAFLSLSTLLGLVFTLFVRARTVALRTAIAQA